MAASDLAMEQPVALFVLLLLAAIALMGSVTSNVPVVAQYANGAAAPPQSAMHAAPVNSFQLDNVLVFQTSEDPEVPCSTAIKRPPDGHNPPVRVVIASPTKTGIYPVILFKHGFVSANCFYTQLLKSLASSGYIVVAPQAKTLNYDCTDELEETANVANWIPISLEEVLKEAVSTASVVPDLLKLVIAGHSRGGKIAFAMALGMVPTKLPNFSALITLDPVDGKGPNDIASPKIVGPACSQHTQMAFPVLIFGTRYGSDRGMFGLLPACAPTCCSHKPYFNCISGSIMYHLVASEYGHNDFLDDDSRSWFPSMMSLMCKAGTKPKALLRNFSVELVVAFLESALQGKGGGMDEIIKNWKHAAIALEEPQVKIHPEDHIAQHNIFKEIPQEQHSEL